MFIALYLFNYYLCASKDIRSI